MKFKVYWWIRGVGGKLRKQGTDIFETEMDFFDEGVAESLIEDDLRACVPELADGTGAKGRFSTYSIRADDDDNFKPHLPNFLKAHREIMKERSVSNWGVTKVQERREKH